MTNYLNIYYPIKYDFWCILYVHWKLKIIFKHVLFIYLCAYQQIYVKTSNTGL